MSVRIPGPDDVERARVANTRTVIDAPVDPMGQVFENLGRAGADFAQRLGEQEAESQVLSADLKARAELDALQRKVETGKDPAQFEAQYGQGAGEILTRYGQSMSANARRVWERRSGELLTQGTIAAREAAQRRLVDQARAGVRQVASDAEAIIANPDSSAEARTAALDTVRIAARKAQGRGVLGADDGAMYVTRVEGLNAEAERTIVLTAGAQQATDAIFAEHETFEARLAAARAIQSPALRARVEDEVTQRQARDNAARDEVMDEAYDHIAEGAAIPPALWERLSGRDKVTIQDYRRARNRAVAADQELPRDRRRISDLNVMAADETRRREFLAVDLQAERGRLGETAYGALREEQDRIRNGGERDGATQATLRSALGVGRIYLRRAGMPLTADGNLTADATTDQADEFIAFQEDLVGLLDRFVAENGGRQPNATEQSMAVQNLLAEHGAGGVMGLGRRTWRTTDTYTPYVQIPQADRERIAARLRAGGFEASRGNVERYYENEQIGARTGRQ